ncbi:MAG: type II CAAX endopeptidase family protein [Pleurocapsa sp.]
MFNNRSFIINSLQQIEHQSAPVRLLVFTGVLIILWLPLAIPIYLWLQHDSNLTTIVTMGLLFVELLLLWRFWGKYAYKESNIYAKYGLTFSNANKRDFIKGLALGFWFCLSLFITEALLGWVEIIPPSISLLRIVIEGLISAIAIAVAEELVFRGWLLDELQRDYGQRTCLWVNATLFALAHFMKPLTEIIRTFVTFPALILLGLTLVLAKKKCRDRLGICIGIHGGLVWGYYILNVGHLIEYTNKVPVWITGIDGNPIAGVMGLIFLTILMLINGSNLLITK